MTSTGEIFGFLYFFVHLLKALPHFFVWKSASDLYTVM